MDTKERELKTLMFKQATSFLEDAGEFFPYGTIIKKDGAIVPIGVYDDKEYLPSEEVIEILEKELSVNIKNKEVILAGIGVDVLVSDNDKNGETIKKNALMIKISTDGVNWTEDYYAYTLQRSVVWE